MNDNILKRIRENEGYTESLPSINEFTKAVIWILVGVVLTIGLIAITTPDIDIKTKEITEKIYGKRPYHGR